MANKYVGKTCPYCKTAFKEDDAIVVCSICDMPHHLSCWQENNGCTTFGCTGVIKDFFGKPEAPISVQESTYQQSSVASKVETVSAEQPVETVKKQERFETLFNEEKNVLQKDSPVLIEKASLIVDHTTDKIIARCCFKCLTDKSIIAMMVDVLCTDIWGKTLKTVKDFQFLDLKTKKDSSFGQTTPIEIPDKSTRSIDVKIKKILFSDRTSVECGDVICSFEAPQTLSDYYGNQAVAEQYARETTKKAKYTVKEYDEYWQCTCGSINPQSEIICSTCQSEKNKLLAILSDNAIVDRTSAYLQLKQQKEEQEKRDNEERIRLAEEQVKLEQEKKEAEFRAAEKKQKKKKKRKKAFLIISVIMIVLLAISAVTYFYGIPMYKYSKAEQMLSDGEYDLAHDAFTKISGFKDSASMANEALYQKAKQLYNAEKYDEAVAVFNEIIGYSDSSDMVFECKYQKALKLLDDGKYDSAYSGFKEIGGYKDSNDLLDECQYQKACSKLSSKDYKGAITIFEDISYYKNSKDKINEAMYGYVTAHKNNNDTTTYSYLQTLKSKGYKDSSTIYSNLYDWKVTIVGWNSSDSTSNTTGQSSISKYKAVICHIELSGGTPGAKTVISVRGSLPNGNSINYTFDDAWYDGSSGWYGWTDGLYTYPEYGTTGTVSVKFYDSSSNLIGQGSIKITN